MNPSDYFMKLLQETDECIFNSQSYQEKVEKRIVVEIENMKYSGELELSSYANTIGYEYVKIAERAFINYKRNPRLSVAKFA